MKIQCDPFEREAPGFNNRNFPEDIKIRQRRVLQHQHQQYSQPGDFLFQKPVIYCKITKKLSSIFAVKTASA